MTNNPQEKCEECGKIITPKHEGINLCEKCDEKNWITNPEEISKAILLDSKLSSRVEHKSKLQTNSFIPEKSICTEGGETSWEEETAELAKKYIINLYDWKDFYDFVLTCGWETNNQPEKHWSAISRTYMGKGSTPSEAIENLKKILKEKDLVISNKIDLTRSQKLLSHQEGKREAFEWVKEKLKQIL